LANSTIFISLLTKAIIYAIYIISLNSWVVGKTGYWAIGHLAFFGLGALFTGIVTVIYGISGLLFYPVALCIILIVAFLSIIPAVITLRLKDHFFILFSIAICEIVRVMVEIIAGPGGFSHITRPPGLQSDLSLLIASLSIFCLSSFILNRFRQHPLNTVCSMIRTNEADALVNGFDVRRIRIGLFMMGGGLACLSGVLFALFTTGSDPQRFTLYEAAILFTLAVLGGLDSTLGAIGAGIFFSTFSFIFERLLRNDAAILGPKISLMLFGIILIVTAIILPGKFFKNSNELSE